MRIRPILFNTDMVRAILDGRKTTTRRALKYPFEVHPNGFITKPRGHDRLCPYEPPYQQGDILYVRETWHKDISRYMYRANYADNEKFYQNGKETEIKWHPSIHMPKEAARIWLRVKDVRAERLQDIKNIYNEGIHFCDCPAGYTWKDTTDMHNCYTDPVGAMEALWDSTIPRGQQDLYSWAVDPWVWVIEFERCERPETAGKEKIDGKNKETQIFGEGA